MNIDRKLIFTASLIFILSGISTNCASERNYELSLKDTLSIFLLKNDKGNFFCIPVQYIGSYHIENFEFTGGIISAGDYEIKLDRNNVNIYIYFNNTTDETGDAKGGVFNLIYSEENGNILFSEMSEPVIREDASDSEFNNYSIFIERYISENDYKKISEEYNNKKIYSYVSIEYDLIIDKEEQKGNIMLDDFILSAEPPVDPEFFPVNLAFFKAKYLQADD